MTLNAKIVRFMDFLAISGCAASLHHSQGGATELSLCNPDREFGYLNIKLARRSQFSAKLLNQNFYRHLRTSWALAQISCCYGQHLLALHDWWKLTNIFYFTVSNLFSGIMFLDKLFVDCFVYQLSHSSTNRLSVSCLFYLMICLIRVSV